MADFEHAVMGPHVGDRLFARLDRFDKIGRMILAHFSAVDLFDGAFRQRILLQILDRLPGDLASVHKESTFCPFKENAIVAFARDNHFDIVRHFDWNFEARGRVILILNQGLPTLVFHWQLEFDRDDFAGARVSGAECPAGNINVVRAPIS